VGLAGVGLGEYLSDNGDVGWAWYEFENGGFDKIVEAWQMLRFRSLIRLKTGEPVLRMICEFFDLVPIFKKFQRVWA
jgi:hypothetical protein